MKKLVPIAFLLIATIGFAQPGGKMRERIKSQKIAFITERLNLTTTEAQEFWPIYNAFETKIERIRSQELRVIRQKMRQNPEMSNTEAEKILADLMNAEDRMYQAKVDLFNTLKGVLPAKKIIQLNAVEDEFNKKLLEHLRDFRDKRQKRN